MAVACSDIIFSHIRAYVKTLDDIAAILPKFTEHVRNFVTTLGTVVDDLVASFEADGKHVETTSEARAICHELRQIMVHSNAYMAKVDNFAWHAKRQDRQHKVLEALRQEPPQREPLKEYLLQLARSLSRAEETYKSFEDSFNGIIKRLEKVLEDCTKNLSEVEKKQLATKITGGILASGAMVGSASVSLGLAAVAAIPTLGIGSMVILGLTGVGVATTGVGIAGITAGATHMVVRQHQKLANAIQVLIEQVKLIISVAKSIQSTIADVRLELDSICDIKDDIESNYEMPDSLMECVKQLFERLIEFGTTCSESHQELKDKKKELNTAITKFLAL